MADAGASGRACRACTLPCDAPPSIRTSRAPWTHVRFLNYLRMYARFARGLPRFLRHTVSPDTARMGVLHRLEHRTEAFLRMLDRGWLGAPRSPYPALLAAAGVDRSDIHAMVTASGIEHTLRTLRQAGVYLTFEEYKGRSPLVRHGREIPLRESDFDNPWLATAYENSTSGSTGVGTRVSTDLDMLAVGAEHRLLFLEAHGLLDVPLATWRPPLPGSGLNLALRTAHTGRQLDRWFTPVVHGDLRPALRFRLANQGTVAIARALGARIPWPEKVHVNNAEPVARWMAETRDRAGGAVLSTTVSGGLRVALAAREAGLDLTGTTFFIAGEPATPAKLSGIHASGAAHIMDYGMADAGRVAVGCARPFDGTDVHVLTDGYSLIPGSRVIPQSGETVEAFYITALLPANPKLLLNVEFDDCGIVEERDCGCPLGALGLNVHLREIRSYGKLVTEGVALVGSDMLRILEEEIPGAFGGTALDYQLVEDEDATGFSRLTLLVHPRVGPVDEDRLVATLLAALRQQSDASDVARAFWETAGTFRIQRAAPFVTRRGKQPTVYRPRPGAGGAP